MTKNQIIKKLKTKPTWHHNSIIGLVERLDDHYQLNAQKIKAFAVGDILFEPGINHPILLVSKRSQHEFLSVNLTQQDKNTVAKLETRYENSSYVYPSIQVTNTNGKKEHYMGSVSISEVDRILPLVYYRVFGVSPAYNEEE